MKLIGTGSFGEVFQVKHKTTGELMAVKAVSKHTAIDKDLIDGFKMEKKFVAENLVESPFIGKGRGFD